MVHWLIGIFSLYADVSIPDDLGLLKIKMVTASNIAISLLTSELNSKLLNSNYSHETHTMSYM